jgi:hypothetical protein
MPIKFPCPGCGVSQTAGDHLAGRTLRCTKCGKTFTVPAAPVPAPAAQQPVLRPARQRPAPPPPPKPMRDDSEDSIFS